MSDKEMSDKEMGTTEEQEDTALDDEKLDEVAGGKILDRLNVGHVDQGEDEEEPGGGMH